MEFSFLLFQKILSMMLMAVMGFAAVRLGAVKKRQTDVLSALTLYIITPCMILSAFQIEFNAERLSGLLLAFGGAAVLHAVFLLLTRLLGGPLRLDGLERASLIYSNCGNLIVPLVSSLLGREWVFYCCAVVGVQTVLVWVHLPRMLDRGYALNARKILLNPNILSIAAGLVLFLTGVRIPGILGDTVSTVGATIGPVSMIMIGMLMAEVDLKAVLARPKNWLVCFGRLVVYPLIVAAIFVFSGMTRMIPDGEGVLLVTMLAACAPVGVSVTQMAEVLGQDAKNASAINVMSVIFCVLTMPLVIEVYQLLCRAL